MNQLKWACAALAATLGLNGMTAIAAISDQEFAALKKQVQREQDAREVANLMGMRSNLYTMGDGSWADYYAKRPDSSFSMNGNHILVGYERIKGAFSNDPARKQRTLEAMIKLYPDIENKPENHGIGDMRIHALLSPVIVVADDGQTAKGYWQSSGPAIAVSNGRPSASMSFEKYAVDFIKEDGQWKFWHIHVGADYNYDLTKPASEQIPAPGSAKPVPGARGGGGPPAGPAPAASGATYESWSPWRVPRQPPLPVPYRTFSETFSYGPPAIAR